MKPTGAGAVMAARHEPPDSLDYFPTPPWATRAGLHYAIGPGELRTCWEPACGEGHMAATLAEAFPTVHASDVHDYGGIPQLVGSFVGEGPDVLDAPRPAPDWVITNPPFRLAEQFVARALDVARVGVAVLVRTAWLEGAARWAGLLQPHPPAVVAQFVERVAMVKGRWDPAASTATSYCWVVWHVGQVATCTRLVWIPPGCARRFTRPGDVRRWAAPAPPAADDLPRLLE